MLLAVGHRKGSEESAPEAGRGQAIAPTMDVMDASVAIEVAHKKGNAPKYTNTLHVVTIFAFTDIMPHEK